MIWTNSATFTTDTTRPESRQQHGGGAGTPADGGTPTTANDPEGDADGDGLVNEFEDLLGLNSVNPGAADGANGDPDGDGKTNIQEQNDLTHPTGTDLIYLAEGATNTTFDTQIALANPTGDDGPGADHVPEGRRHGDQDLRPDPAADAQDDRHQGHHRARHGGVLDARRSRHRPGRRSHHDSGAQGGLRQPRRARHRHAHRRRRGTSPRARRSGLQPLLPDPEPDDDQDAAVRGDVPAAGPGGAARSRPTPSARQSRFNIWVDNEGITDPALAALASTDVSAIIESTNGVPIIAERAMYLNQRRAGLRRRPRERGRHRAGDAVVPGRGRDRRLLRPVHPDREPERARRRPCRPTTC